MKKSHVILALVLGAGLVGTVAVLTAAAATPVLPGITSADERPNGCIDCHKGDTALPVLLKNVKGHPDVTKVVKKVPTDCGLCHKPGGSGKIPPLSNAVHGVHYADPAKNTFVTTYGGQCLNCHQLVAATAEMKVKAAAANW